MIIRKVPIHFSDFLKRKQRELLSAAKVDDPKKMKWDTAPMAIFMFESSEPSSNENVALKLFVWRYSCPDYKDGLVFALAESVEEAQRLVRQECSNGIYNLGTPFTYPLTEKFAVNISE